MQRLIILYDNYCPMCTKFVRLVSKLDWLDLIELEQLRNLDDLNKPIDVDLNLALKQMASYNGKWNYGYISIYCIFSRLPLFWILFPIFFLLKISGIGQFIYKELAVKRKIIPIHCDENSCKI